MTDETITASEPYVRQKAAEVLEAPVSTRGLPAWLRDNLFSTPFSAVLTLASLAFVLWAVPGLIRYLFIDSVWTGSAQDCREAGGACWAFVRANLSYFVYASYPLDQRWRVDIWMIVNAVMIVWLLWPRSPHRGIVGLVFVVVFPFFSYFLLSGSSWVGLPKVETHLWGGLFVSLLVSIVGIVFSLPAGILLALGRRSNMPVVKLVCVIFIEFVRGVPLITVLFMANTMLPLFVPQYLTPDRLLRPLIGVSLFAAAYMAEVIRGGLQAMPKGQFEGAMAVGLNYPQMMRLVILPQALTLVIPGIVNTFIGLFKDTTLVAIVGIYDFLRAIEIRRLDPEWASAGSTLISTTGYVFAALFYFIFCFGMSRYSLYMERKLAAGRKR